MYLDLLLVDLNLSQNLDLFKLLTFTYPRYTDPLSRDAVEAVGMEMVRRDELRGTPEGAEDEQKLGITEQILGWLSHEVARLSKASSRCVSTTFKHTTLELILFQLHRSV